ncbi:MAG: tRNA pseudouridine(38-40) synthase TruA [Rhodocyclaceae bacterium]|nr:tRNA pseudouridine(38-40) synthase TruA [Rhodocyclaceae bacterium]
MRFAIGIEYDGSRFCGWQSQANGCGLQDAVEKALSAIAATEIQVVCAGRTDAGVHATGQVVHFDTTASRPEEAWVRGTNASLPREIAVLWAKQVGDDFHARFSARARRYRYVLLNRAQRPGIMDKRVGWYHHSLDDTRMRESASCLLGEHDFSAFRAAECQAKTPVRTLRRIDIARAGDLLYFDFEANAFLHHMIRNILGALVMVGSLRRPAEWVNELLVHRDRTLSAATFSAHGLYLSGVDYDSVWNLPVGAGETPLVIL